ncbi:MAG: NADH-quinone oxidoreductase subunit C [Kiritimatiellae bacterium]|nr:NADH-quinone oxidoreductase subunit C [Kiritimatiellia bacterium]NLD90473.1 NADH-quinone oxidoreductase subunit C [Lentisphaerota bacterium]
MNLLAPQEIADALQAAAGAGFVSARCTEWAEGIKGRKSRQVWLKIAREALIQTLQRLVEIHYPHVSVIAFCDTGAQVELVYHFHIYWGVPREEILVTLTVALDKTDLKVPTITGIIPGALTSEREKQEMLGIEVVGIPDGRRLFLPEDFPQGVFPWRKDETGIPADMVKDLWATGRENLKFQDNPPPPASNPVNPV